MESFTHPTAISDPVAVTGEAHPFSRKWVELTQAEHIELKWQGNYWKRQHGDLKRRNEALKQELDLAHAKIRDLKQRLYGKRSEKKTTQRDQPGIDNGQESSRPRGQQEGSKGHGRTPRPDLPIIEETRDSAPEDRSCALCGKTYRALSQTEDSRIIEVRVQAHVRLIRRKMYTQVCECDGVPGLVTAPPAPRVIPNPSLSSPHKIISNNIMLSFFNAR